MAFKFGTQKSLGLGIIGGGGAILKPQEVFATSLYTGAGAAQTVTSGVDLLGKGGLFWLKERAGASNGHVLMDTARVSGANDPFLQTNTTGAEVGAQDYINYLSTGVRFNSSIPGFNDSGMTYASWSFARAAKFFDIVTWTGDGTASRQIPHGLGVVPGMIVMKARTGTTGWFVYHRGTGNGGFLTLNTTDAFTSSSLWSGGTISDTSFPAASGAAANGSGIQYVAYLFAHDPSAEGIVQCGSFTGTPATINLGWPAQFFMHKRTDATDDWYIYDTARGFGSGADKLLRPNTSAAEQSFDFGEPTSTGVTVNSGATAGTNIYLAIRAPY